MTIIRYFVLIPLAAAVAQEVTLVEAQTRHAGDPQAGRALALQACTGCHVVAADQPFKPVYSGTPHPPDFRDVANRPEVTTEVLQRHLSSLPAVPSDSHMANPVLSSQQLSDVAAYIITLRNK